MQKTPTITLAFDPSASESKGIYQIDDHGRELITMSPEIISVTSLALESLEQIQLVSHPELCAWIKLSQTNYAVGHLAKQRFNALHQIKEAKYESAAKKILAMVGAIAEKNRLKEATLNLGTFLPYGELSDAERLKELLKKYLRNLNFRGENYQIEIENWLCLPEGMGLALLDLNSQKPINMLVIMLGYRNASYLLFEGGTLTQGNSTPLGFSTMLEEICRLTSANDPREIVKIICQIPRQMCNAHLEPLLKSADQDIRKIELKELKTAIKTNRCNYLENLKKWLKQEQLPNVDKVILGGGTAYYYQQELEDYFSNIAIDWREDLEKRVQTLVEDDHQKYWYRLTDLNGLWYFFYQQTQRQSLKTTALSKI